jgi:FkbM family methyltransferase
MIVLFKKINNRIHNILFREYGIPKSRNGSISKAVVKKYLPANPVMIDCGAHDGSDSMELARLFKGEVHAFEPLDDIFIRLVNNAKQYKNIHCYKIALSNEDGINDFYISEGGSNMSSSLLEPQQHLIDHPDVYFKEKMSVKTLTLDSWATANGIERVDLLWLDMQGSELDMLKASERILPTVKVIYTEVSVRETYKGVALYPELKMWLEQKGFKVIIEAIPEYWDMGNVLFVRE